MINEEIFDVVNHCPCSATKRVLMIMQDLDDMPKHQVEEKVRDNVGYGRPHVLRLFNQSIQVELETPEAIKIMEDLKDKYLRVYLGHWPMYFSEKQVEDLL